MASVAVPTMEQTYPPFASPFAPVVVAPTHNNDGTLADVVRRVRALGLPLIVVDDGSTDTTGFALRHLAANDAGVTVITHACNRGKGAALRTGFAAAGGAGHTHAVTIDTDGQHDPEHIPALLALARRSPDALVIGRRDENTKGYPGRSRLGRQLSNVMVWMECGVRVGDSQCGLRVYPLDLVREVPCHSGHYGFETEIISRAGWANRPVLEAPVRCRYLPKGQAVSHFRPWADSLRGICMHARLFLRAMVPWPHPGRAAVAVPDPAPQQPTWRRLLNWFNPVPAWRQMRDDDDARATAAAGLALGAFIANLPVYGLQTILSLYAARRLHVHPVAVVTGSHLSTPPVGPVLAAAAIGVGHLLLHGAWPGLSHFDVRGAGIWPLLRNSAVEWAVGSVFVGLLCAGVTYTLAKWSLRLVARPAMGRRRKEVPSNTTIHAAAAVGAAA